MDYMYDVHVHTYIEIEIEHELEENVEEDVDFCNVRREGRITTKGSFLL
jgi:hypothetical protein